MSDEGFHEIQLNGKQLVFLFMAATVVSVVIFLCGVMVGRGVQTSRGASGDAEEVTADVRPVAGAEGSQTGGTVEGPPPTEPPPVENDYHERLTGAAQRESLPAEGVRATASGAEKKSQAEAPESRPPAPATKATEKPTPAPAAQRPAAAPARSTVQAGDPTSSSGYAVQLAALRERNEAEAIVKRLVQKGYQAYVLVPAPGAPPVYRVQVGRFPTRSEAERTAARLRKQEQFTPWVTR